MCDCGILNQTSAVPRSSDSMCAIVGSCIQYSPIQPLTEVLGPLEREDPLEALGVCLEAGDMLIMHALLVHSVAHNHRDTMRTFARASVPYAAPFTAAEAAARFAARKDQPLAAMDELLAEALARGDRPSVLARGLDRLLGCAERAVISVALAGCCRRKRCRD